MYISEIINIVEPPSAHIFRHHYTWLSEHLDVKFGLLDELLSLDLLQKRQYFSIRSEKTDVDQAEALLNHLLDIDFPSERFELFANALSNTSQSHVFYYITNPDHVSISLQETHHRWGIVLAVKIKSKMLERCRGSDRFGLRTSSLSILYGIFHMSKFYVQI